MSLTTTLKHAPGLSPRRQARNGEPFVLDRDDGFREWRTRKLEHYPQSTNELIVEIRDPLALTPAERSALIARCRRANMAIYACAPRRVHDKEHVRQLGAELGLCRLDTHLCADNDGLSTLQVAQRGRQEEYIPYTNRALSWHTDGYYNAPAQTIRAFLLHCVCDAQSGGENKLLDPEIVYLLMRDADPTYIAALMRPDTMTVPANVQSGVEIRSAKAGPVFSVDPATGVLHMRYTGRTRSIQWNADAQTQAAVRFLQRLLADSPYIFHHRLQPGQGLVCNNVLHARAGFQDNPAAGRVRLLYRGRYYDRITGTG
jgi:hypothetical protein